MTSSNDLEDQKSCWMIRRETRSSSSARQLIAAGRLKGPDGKSLINLRRLSYYLGVKQHFRLPGGDLEYAVLAKLWEFGSASVREIHAQVAEPKRLAYTTTAKVLDRLYAKRLVSRERKGIAFIYRPRAPRAAVDTARARNLLSRMLGPAPCSSMAALVDAVESLDPRLLDELAQAVATRRRPRDGT